MDYKSLGINEKIVKLTKDAEKKLEKKFKEFEQISLLCSGKVMKAFHDNRLSSSHFAEVTGYGYYDFGRDTLEKIYCHIFKAEDALVRPQIMSGTHALTLALSGLLKHGDTMISISGEPYDSLKSVIGLAGESRNSLLKNGILYEQIDLVENDFDYLQIKKRLAKRDVKLVEIQRSRGYSNRKSLSISQIEKVVRVIREVNSDVIIMVDNCYGDFTQEREPIEVGCDILVGSLMKNLGGGMVKAGGYVVGKRELINDVAERFSSPCVGKDAGANYGQLLGFFKGLFMAPGVVCSALKTAALLSFMLEKLGFEVSPKWNETRSDIVQVLTLGSRENMEKFCAAYQKGTMVDSFATPVPSQMPGYPHEEIMASGSFTTGSTLELSCDGPVVAPFRVFAQGALTYDFGKLGVMVALSNFLKES